MYAWTLYLPAVICLWLALDGRPWGAPDERSLLLDCSLALVAGALILQLVPLPAAVADAVSPALRPTRERIFLRLPSWLPVTIDPRSGAWAAMVGIGTLVIFLTARRLLNSSGVRMFVRGLTAIGLVLSAIGLAQDASGQGLMYWRTAPLQEGAPPFGPFVDRNSFATWVLLAVPLCSRLSRGARTGSPSRRASGEQMDGARAASARRAGDLHCRVGERDDDCVAGDAVTIGHGEHGGSDRAGGVSGRATGTAAGSGSPGSWPWAPSFWLLAMSRIDPVVLGRRFASARTSAADRLVIWRETLPIVRDFWLTGTGAGTYETAMLVYQRSSPGVRFNQAHNHYLQLASEGGVLLGVPVLLSLVAYGFGAAKRARGGRVEDVLGQGRRALRTRRRRRTERVGHGPDSAGQRDARRARRGHRGVPGGGSSGSDPLTCR